MVYSRREVLRKGGRAAAVIGGGAFGYGVGATAAGVITRGLERAVELFYGLGHDFVSEISAAEDRRLQKAAEDVRKYVGQAEEDYKKYEAYWSGVHVLDAAKFRELTADLENIDKYSEESKVLESLIKMRDRIGNRLLTLDQEAEAKYPQKLRDFNDWFTRTIKGEESGSRKALEVTRQRLSDLVKVYDINRENKLAQTELLKNVDTHFAEAQKEVVRMVDQHLASKDVTDPDERKYLELLKELATEDPKGKRLADFVLNTRNYFSTLEVTERLRSLKGQLGGAITYLTDLQGRLDEGIALKKEIRASREQDFPLMRQKVKELYETMEQKKKELEENGYKIEYELWPKVKTAKDDVISAIMYSKIGVGGVVGALAGLAAYWLSGKVPGMGGKVSRRKFMGMEIKYLKLKAQMEEEEKLKKLKEGVFDEEEK